MSSFSIKLIAIISMLLDHSGDVFFKRFTFLNVLGRIAFPLFAFQLVVGYSNTRNSKKYLLRLLLFAFISQIPYVIFKWYAFGDYSGLNIFFTLVAGIIVMMIADYQPKFKFTSMIIPWMLKFLFIFIISILAQVLYFDYGAWGTLLILLIHVFYPNQSIKSDKNSNNTSDDLFDKQDKTKLKAVYIKPALEKLSKKTRTIIFILAMLFMMIIKYVGYLNMEQFNYILFARLISLIVFTFLPTIIMLFYNGKKGPSMKYFFYLFYPVHLLLITGLAVYCFKS